MKDIFSTAFLMGGLGNQMFQIANAYSQGLDGSVDTVFRPFSQTNLQGHQTEKYVNNIFKKIKFVNSLEDYARYYEPNWHYNDKKFLWDKSIEFYGYYQSSKNFLSFSNEVISLFEMDYETKNYLLEKYNQLYHPDNISIHVRRGDYVNYPNTHPVISKSYIDSSLNEIGKYDYIFVFTDDKNWVKNNLNYNNMIFVDEEDYIELWLMSLCKNNILSNSSFSWWGSFLNTNKNKKIIAPSIWFGPEGPKNFQDIYEPYWTVLNVTIKDGELITN